MTRESPEQLEHRRVADLRPLRGGTGPGLRGDFRNKILNICQIIYYYIFLFF